MSTNPEEYHTDDTAESPETGTAYDREGEPASTPHDEVLAEEDAAVANPNSSSSGGLAGDMGLSSERTGPADETGTDGLGDLGGIEGTGTVGSARHSTHGSKRTTGGPDLPKSNEHENPADPGSHELHHKNPGHSGGT
jgi:hypothetical protein